MKSIFLQRCWECRTQWSQCSRPVVLKWINVSLSVHMLFLSYPPFVFPHFRPLAGHSTFRPANVHLTLYILTTSSVSASLRSINTVFLISRYASTIFEVPTKPLNILLCLSHLDTDYLLFVPNPSRQNKFYSPARPLGASLQHNKQA